MPQPRIVYNAAGQRSVQWVHTDFGESDAPLGAGGLIPDGSASSLANHGNEQIRFMDIHDDYVHRSERAGR